MTKPTIYTLGYAGRSPRHTLGLLDLHDALLVDIRYSPYSKDPRWCREGLRTFFGQRYYHLPQLGNVNYKNGGIMRLSDYDLGKRRLLGLAERPLILMCACADPAACHRTYMAKLLRADGFDVSELSVRREEPPMPQLSLF